MRFRPQCGASLAGFLFVLLGLETLARSSWFEQLPLGSNFLFHKQQWVQKKAPASWLLFGDSTAHFGLSGREFSEGARGLAWNCATIAGTPITAEKLRAAALEPTEGVVLAGLSVFYSDGPLPWPTELEVLDWAQAMALIGPVRGLLSSSWVSWRRRSGLRELVLSGGQLRPEVHMEADPFGTASLWVASMSDEQRLAHARGLVRTWRAQVGTRRGVRFEALERLAGRVRGRHRRLVLVWMPVSRSMRETFAEFEREGPERWVSELRERTGIEWLDCRAALPERAFVDANHIAPGELRDRFSRSLGEAIAKGDSSCPSLGD